MKSFTEFVDKKARETKRQLKLVQEIIKKDGLDVKNHLSEGDPYIYIADPGKQLSFGGVRIYKIGGSISFRVQKEEKTHPYGNAYPLDIESMYDDLISDDTSLKKAGDIIMQSIVKEIRTFFVKSAEAEKDLRAGEFDRDDPMKSAFASSQGTDYHSTVHNKGRQY